MLTNQIYIFEPYNVLPLYFITGSYLHLSYFSVGFLYILLQKLLFSFLTHNPRNSVENM